MLLKKLLLLLVWLTPQISHGSQIIWEINSDYDNIQTFRQSNYSGRIIPIKAQYVLRDPLEEIAAVLADTPAKVHWVPRMADAKVLKMISPYHRIEHLTMDMPWPSSDRDVVVDIKVKIPRQGDLEIIVKSLPDSMAQFPPQPGVVRAEVYSANMTLKSRQSGEIFVVAEAHSDPKGNIPAWIINFIQDDLLRKTIANMITRIKGRHYPETELSTYRRLLSDTNTLSTGAL